MNDRDFRETMRHYRREFTITMPGGHHDLGHEDDLPDTRGYRWVPEDQVPETDSFFAEESKWSNERTVMSDAAVAHADEIVEALSGIEDLEDRKAFMDDFARRATGIRTLDDCGCDACLADRRHSATCACELCDAPDLVSESHLVLDEVICALNGEPVRAFEVDEKLRRSHEGRECLCDACTDIGTGLDDGTDFGPTRVSGSKIVIMAMMDLHHKSGPQRERLSQAKSSSLKQAHRRRPEVYLPMPASAMDL